MPYVNGLTSMESFLLYTCGALCSLFQVQRPHSKIAIERAQRSIPLTMTLLTIIKQVKSLSVTDLVRNEMDSAPAEYGRMTDELKQVKIIFSEIGSSREDVDRVGCGISSVYEETPENITRPRPSAFISGSVLGRNCNTQRPKPSSDGHISGGRIRDSGGRIGRSGSKRELSY